MCINECWSRSIDQTTTTDNNENFANLRVHFQSIDSILDLIDGGDPNGTIIRVNRQWSSDNDDDYRHHHYHNQFRRRSVFFCSKFFNNSIFCKNLDPKID